MRLTCPVSCRCLAVVLAVLSLLTFAVSGCSSVNSPDKTLIPTDKPGPEWQKLLMRDIVDSARQLNTFNDVTYIDKQGEYDLPDVLESAWDSGMDVVIRPVLERNDAWYIDDAGAFVPNLIIWLVLSPIPTWFIADAKFGTEFRVRLEFYSTATRGKEAFQQKTISSGKLEYTLNDFQQSFDLFGIFKTPGGLDEGNWEEIGKNTQPLARQARRATPTCRTLARKTHATAPNCCWAASATRTTQPSGRFARWMARVHPAPACSTTASVSSRATHAPATA